MDLSQFNFAHPMWLWGNLVLLFVWLAFLLFYRVNTPSHQFEKFVDSHLLPYLLINKSKKKGSVWKTLLLWSAVWSCLTVAMAGPRWDFREIETFSRDQSLVILLDLSESMNATDVKPSRLVRAKQKIEDLINLSQGVKIGLIAFAADPHMIAPVTDDKETIRHLLPSLGTDLVYVQGSKLAVALEMGAQMLEVEPGNNKALLVISDGGFEDSSSLTTVKKLTEKGLAIHAMGVGLLEGTPLKDSQGNVVKQNGVPIMSKLEEERLKGITEVGGGRYLQAHYSSKDELAILSDLEKRAEAQAIIGKKSRLWDERFYLLLFIPIPFILWWFRRGYVFAVLFAFLIPGSDLEAASFKDYFKNSEERGKAAYEEADYSTAISSFKDSYRKGVAYYKLGDFANAEKMFLESSREEVSSNALYNLGNALAYQQKLKEAIKAYEKVLDQWPDHLEAKENLELVKNILDQQKGEGEGDDSSSDESGDDQKEGGDQKKKDSSKSDDSDKEDEEKKSDSEQSDDKSDKQESEEKENPSKAENSEESKEEENSEEKDQQEAKDANQEDVPELQEEEKAQDENKDDDEGEDPPKAQTCRSQQDLDADLWLNQLSNDPKAFLKNKFYIESKKNGTTRGINPW